jgi:hypothetical protein
MPRCLVIAYRGREDRLAPIKGDDAARRAQMRQGACTSDATTTNVK